MIFSGLLISALALFANADDAPNAVASTTDFKGDWDVYWSSAQLCREEFDLSTCILDCNTISDFVLEPRIATCLKSFVKSYCGKIAAGVVAPCVNDRASITTVNCQSSAMADALIVLKQVQNLAISHVEDSNVVNSFDMIKASVALRTVRTHVDCVTDAFFYFVNQCTAKNYGDDLGAQCVEDALSSNECYKNLEYYKDDNLDLAALLHDFARDVEKNIPRFIRSHFPSLPSAIGVLRNILRAYVQAGVVNRNPFDSTFDRALEIGLTGEGHSDIEATVDVCPVKYLSMNSGDVQGLPAKLVNFHFPVDGHMDDDDSTVVVSTNPAEKSPALDPFTPPAGIRGTCKNYFIWTRVVYEQGGNFDAGDMCYTIDGYDIFFVETGRSVPLSFEPIRNIRHQTQHEAPCFHANWKSQKTCSNHLSQWRMHVRCCKSYKTWLDEQNSYKYEQAALLAQDYTNATATPAPYTYPTSCPPDVEYTKTVLSSNNNGMLYQPEDHKRVRKWDLKRQYNEWYTKLTAANKFAQLSLALGDQNKLIALVLTMVNHPIIIDMLLQEEELPAPAIPYYIGGDYYARQTCPELNIDLDFATVIQLFTRVCYPQSCALSQYFTCLEQDNSSPREFIAPVVYGPSSTGYGTALLASVSSNSMNVAGFAFSGFLAGVLVVAVAQKVMKNKQQRVAAVIDAEYSNLM